MSEQKTECVQLHLHTTVSDDVSVITPREAIETAVKLGHKAVAVTNLNSVQDFPELEACQRRFGNNLKVIYGAQVHYLKGDTTYAVALLAKNDDGLKGLYRILSAMREYGNCKVVDWQVIEDNRRNLLCGCDCALMTERKASVRECRTAHIFDNSSQLGNCELVGESDATLQRFSAFLEETRLRSTLGDTRPLFLYNFLERLDETVDIGEILKALVTTGRQICIAVPHCYQIKILEEKTYDTTIHSL